MRAKHPHGQHWEPNVGAPPVFEDIDLTPTELREFARPTPEEDREMVIPLPEGYTGVGEWGHLFATILNKRKGLATQADVDEQVTAVLNRPGIDWEMVAHQAGHALDASAQALADKVARLRAAHLRYVCLSTQLSTPEGRMHCSGVAAGLDMAIAVVEDILTADDDITVTEE